MRVERGFSLLEIMVAFTLLALALAVFLQAFGGGVHLLGDADRLARAATLAQSQLAQVGLEIPLAEGVTQAEWPPDYRVRLQVAPVSLPAQLSHPHWQLWQVEVVVDWTEAGRVRAYRLVSLRVGKRSDAG